MDAVKKWKKSQNNAYKNKTKGKKKQAHIVSQSPEHAKYYICADVHHQA